MEPQNRTIQDIYQMLYDGLCVKFGQQFKLLPKSFVRVWCKVAAGVFIICHKDTAWWGLQQYPEKAYYGNVSCLGMTINPLVMLGNLFGAGEPKPSTQWQGTARVTVEGAGGFLWNR